MTVISTIEQLEAIYGFPNDASTVKVADRVTPPYRVLIEKSPFAALATCGPEGLDCSPRGDPPGFVRVVGKNTLLIPDRRGNNRVDCLRNLVRDPRISLLFMIPGVGNTLRVNGRATISVAPDLLASFAMNGRLPKCVVEVTAQRVYFQCPKALVRSRLWSADAQIASTELPSTGEMLQAITAGGIDGKTYDEAYPQRLKETIY
jgi:uncharacterized protein